MKRSEIVAEARKYVALKARWSRMQRTPTRMDCYGLIVLVRAAFGLKSDTFTRYGLYPEGDLGMEVGRRMFTQVHPPFKDGQLIVFAQSGHPLHLGILSTDAHGRLCVIHCAADRKFCMEEPFEGELKHHFRAIFEFPGVEED